MAAGRRGRQFGWNSFTSRRVSQGVPSELTYLIPADKVSQNADFERYVVADIPALLRVARSWTLNNHDDDDRVQNTILRAYHALDRFDGAHPRARLFTILRNTHVDRNRKRRPELLDDPSDTDASPQRRQSDRAELAK